MKFDIYGRFELEVSREGNAWCVYRLGTGIKLRVHDVVLPADIDEHDIANFLDDIFHEAAQPGRRVRRV